MKSTFKKIPLFRIAIIFLVLQGCTIATHEEKNKYWAMQPDMQQLPSVGIVAKDMGYVSYPLLFSRKKLFRSVATCGGGVMPAEIEVKIVIKPASNIAVALSWLVISGSSAFIIPYRADNARHAEFIVRINGEEVKKFEYNDTKYIWIATFGMFAGALSQKNDEYYVEELIADQFVNSFIIDLYKDKDLIEKIKSAG